MFGGSIFGTGYTMQPVNNVKRPEVSKLGFLNTRSIRATKMELRTSKDSEVSQCSGNSRVEASLKQELVDLTKKHKKAIEKLKKAHTAEVNNVKSIAVENSIHFIKTHTAKTLKTLTLEHHGIIKQHLAFKERTNDHIEDVEKYRK